jgi:CspA family cold shock protein
MAEKTMRGTVRKWTERGFGFIAPDGGGKDVFVHYSSIQSVGDRRRDLVEGARVQFTVADDDRGPRAKGVTVIG